MSRNVFNLLLGPQLVIDLSPLLRLKKFFVSLDLKRRSTAWRGPKVRSEYSRCLPSCDCGATGSRRFEAHCFGRFDVAC